MKRTKATRASLSSSASEGVPNNSIFSCIVLLYCSRFSSPTSTFYSAVNRNRKRDYLFTTMSDLLATCPHDRSGVIWRPTVSYRCAAGLRRSMFVQQLPVESRSPTPDCGLH